MVFSRGVKFWVIMCLLSMFFFNLYWSIEGYDNFFTYLAGQSPGYNYVSRVGLVFWGGLVGYTTRFIALILCLISAFLMWVKSQNFLKIKALIAISLLLESLYFIGLIPSVPYLLSFSATFLTVAYILHIVFATPVLIILAFKLIRYENDSDNSGLAKLSSLAVVGYVASLWANSLFRWFDMLATEGIAFLSSGPRALGFLNSAVFMSLAIIFSIVGSYRLSKKKEESPLSWFGLSFASVGIHFVICVIYSIYVNALNYALLVDIWAIPLLGLGLTMLITKME